MHFGKISRLSIEIDPEQHRQIKTLAAFAGLSIKDHILVRTLPAKPATADTTGELLKSPRGAARLRQAIAVPVSKHLVFASLSRHLNVEFNKGDF